MLRRIPLASKTVLVGGLAAVSLAVTGVALAVPGGPMSPASDATTTTSTTPTDKPSEDAAQPKKAADRPEADDSDAPDAAKAAATTAENRTCPWPTPAAVPTPHDNGLHCGWYKPGRTAPRPHPTHTPNAHAQEHAHQHGSAGKGSDGQDGSAHD